MTLEEAQAQLVIVETAISELIQGKKKNELRIGDNVFYKHFKYSEVSLENLLSYRNELYALIEALTITPIVPTFRKNTSFELCYSKSTKY